MPKREVKALAHTLREAQKVHVLSSCTLRVRASVSKSRSSFGGQVDKLQEMAQDSQTAEFRM